LNKERNKWKKIGSNSMMEKVLWLMILRIYIHSRMKQVPMEQLSMMEFEENKKNYDTFF